LQIAESNDHCQFSTYFPNEKIKKNNLNEIPIFLSKRYRDYENGFSLPLAYRAQTQSFSFGFFAQRWKSLRNRVTRTTEMVFTPRREFTVSLGSSFSFFLFCQFA
jgi:hypothetical protein